MSKKLTIVLSLMSIIPLAIAFGLLWMSPWLAEDVVDKDSSEIFYFVIIIGCLSGGITVGVATIVMWALALVERWKLNKPQ